MFTLRERRHGRGILISCESSMCAHPTLSDKCSIRCCVIDLSASMQGMPIVCPFLKRDAMILAELSEFLHKRSQHCVPSL